MVKKLIRKITAWSYSRYSDYVKCPYLAFLKHVEKRREPDNQYTIRGGEAHTEAAQFITKQIKNPTGVMENFVKEFKELRKNNATVEHEWAFRQDWMRCDWFDPACWLRVKMDACDSSDPVTVKVVDHKTGKVRTEHREQRELYAIAALIIFPLAKQVSAMHWYLDSGERTGELYERKDLEKLKKKWAKKVVPMMADTIFAPKPGVYCRWCHFRAANGGPCKF